MKIAIPRLTFRLHDNPLLSKADKVLVILQRENINKFSSQQLNLLLQTIKIHLSELPIKADFKVLSLKEIEHELSKLSSANCFISDYVTDPVYNDFNTLLRKYKTKFINTFTLLDWRDGPHCDFLYNFNKGMKSVYSKLTPLKNYIVENTQSLKISGTLKKVKKVKNSLPVELGEMISNLQKEMQNSGVTLHKFTLGDAAMLIHAHKMLKIVDYKSWSKPKTNASAIWGEQDTANRATTQLSPYLAIGALSARWCWSQLKEESAKLGTIRDQFLWRESFHSFAIASELKLTPRVSHFWSDKMDSLFVQNYKWKNDKALLRKWQTGTVTEFPAKNLNAAMQQLFKTGWIHHLARHLVADVLTRGKFLLSWQEGERWFRRTLLDHDAVLNRANWMWLSAVAFSSKQKAGYHYNPNNYLDRH